MSKRLSATRATREFEEWMGQGIPLIESDLKRKHELMAHNPLRFLRATYYLWLERFQAEFPELLTLPAVVGVGDLHLENFGTWTTSQGRDVWAVNDFDELAWAPYSIDLVRLASSMRLGLGEMERKSKVLDELLGEFVSGWRDGVTGQIGPIFLDEGRHAHLQSLIPPRDPLAYWAQLHALRLTKDVPAPASELVALVAPSHEWKAVWHIRVAGSGSLGHRRLVALGEHDGNDEAREVKDLGSPTVAWPVLRPVGARGSDAAWRLVTSEPERRPIAHTRHEGWQSRRMSPGLARIEVEALGSNSELRRVVAAMGRALAVVHGSDQTTAAAAVEAEQGLDRHWLRDASHTMAQLVHEDFETWREHQAKGG